MGKKKRTFINSAESFSVGNESSNPSTKEITTNRVETDSIIENIPLFKNPKFVLAKAASKKNRVWKSLRQITTAENSVSRVITYISIDSPVSLKPPKKYSDVSGLEAKYTDPQTKMRFANAHEFQIIRSLQPEVVNNYLSLRKANLLMLKRLYLKLCSTATFKILLRSHYFVCTPIFYVNGAPHIGHMQSCLYADALARTHRLLGKDVLFSTGTDEHGLKVQQSAEALKIQVSEHCEQMSSKYKDAFGKANISYSHFIRTTDKKHMEMVQRFWKKLDNNGYIKKDNYEGWYSVVDEAFVPSSQVKEIKEDSKTKMISIETGSSVEKMSEENYVFRLSDFQNDLLYWLSKDVIKPAIFADAVKRLIIDGLNDLSISRPRSRLSWGIPVPNDESQTIYVWLDALVNYLTVGNYQSTKTYWPPNCHVIGKDILKFHAIYWPAFLIAAGYEPPKKIFCHSHWTVDYEKMSKSKGNVIDPLTLMDRYSSDGFRYFMLRASVPHSDTNYSEEKMHRMLNAELADNLGNLLSRVCAVAVNPKQEFPQLFKETLDQMSESNVFTLINNTSKLPEEVQEHFLDGYFYKGLDLILECLRDANTFLQFNKPWELSKMNDEESQEKLSTVLHVVLEVLRVSGLLLQPVVPTLSAKILDKLHVPENERSWQNIYGFLSYYNLPNPLEGKPLGNIKLPLYDRKVTLEQVSEQKQSKHSNKI